MELHTREPPKMFVFGYNDILPIDISVLAELLNFIGSRVIRKTAFFYILI